MRLTPLQACAIALASALSTLSVLAATPAWAHSFDVDIVFSTDAPTPARDRFMVEFHRAAAERDAHADEEADGHLGGLDVYTEATGFGGDGSRPTGDFVVVANGGTACGRLAAATGASGIMIDAARLAGTEQAALYRADYRDRYGAAPDEPALLGYFVARQIDAIVRPLGGVDDVAALRKGLDGLLCD